MEFIKNMEYKLSEKIFIGNQDITKEHVNINNEFNIKFNCNKCKCSNMHNLELISGKAELNGAKIEDKQRRYIIKVYQKCKNFMNRKYNTIHKEYTGEYNTIHKEYTDEYKLDLTKMFLYEILKEVLPSPIIYRVKCMECNSINYLIIIGGSQNTGTIIFNGNEIIINEACEGTFNKYIPNSITYYLKEASKCKYAKAYTAAIVMYRTTLENILYENGYKENSLKQSIDKLEKDKKNGESPIWSFYIDETILNIIRKVGNLAAHSNCVEVLCKENIELIMCLDDIIKYMLEKIYDENVKKDMLFSKFKSLVKDIELNI